MRPGPSPYNHTQAGGLVITTIVVLLLACWALALASGEIAPIVPLTLFFAAILLVFYCLQVEVDDEAIRIRFGAGLIRKTIPLDRVAECEKVRNAIWHGWGVRYIGRGWLYNVSGLDAVEVRFHDGKRTRIGTDDPDGLLQAIRDRLQISSPGPSGKRN